jgi:4-amino-4-deoxy-L-arabinose transferase-like glycosyltransferase
MLMWVMVVLVAAAFAIRVCHLGVSDLTFDEAASAFISAKPYPEMIRYLLTAPHELPPVYYVLLRAWEFAAGRSEFALRFPSVILGVFGVALIYRLGRRGLGIGAGIVAALLLALQPFYTFYSQDARPYTLMPVEAMLMVYFFDRLCSDQRLRWWLAFGATSALAVLTHYFMGYMVAALCVYLLLHARAHRRVILPWFGGLGVAGAAVVIWLFTSRAWRVVQRIFVSISWPVFIARLTPAQGMLAYIAFGPTRHLSSEWRVLIAALVVLGLLVNIFYRRWRTLKPGGAWLLPAWLVIPLLLWTLVPERLEPRYVAEIVPAYCLALALAVVGLWQIKYTRPLAPVALGLLLYAQVTTLIPGMNMVKSDYGHVIDYLRRHARPGDSLILNGDWQWVQLLYYPAPEVFTPGSTYRLPPHTPPGLDPAQARPELEKALATSKRVWVLPAAIDDTDPERFVLGWLNEHAYTTSDYKELALYTVGNSSSVPTLLDPPVTFDDTVQLTSYRWVQARAVPGEPLLLDLNWQALSAPQKELAISIALADRDGGVWYSAQFVPSLFYAPPSTWRAGESHTERLGILVPFGNPSGEFDLRASIIGLRPSTGGDYVTLTGAKVLPCSQATPCPPMMENVDFTPVNARFGDGLSLVGYQLGGPGFFQGHFASITLYWRPDRPLADGIKERIALVDRAGHIVAQTEGPPVAAWVPSSQWTPGQILADPKAMVVPPRVPAGDYSFRVSLFTSDGRALPVTSRGASKDWLDVGRVRISARERQFRAGPISHPLMVEFGDRVRLLGYDITPGQEVKLTLYWQALREMDENYTVFTHIMSADNKLAGQKDSEPRDGDSPTSSWMRGEVVKDEYRIPFSPDVGPGPYRIELGLYDRANMQRLPASLNGARLKDDMMVVPLIVER